MGYDVINDDKLSNTVVLGGTIALSFFKQTAKNVTLNIYIPDFSCGIHSIASTVERLSDNTLIIINTSIENVVPLQIILNSRISNSSQIFQVETAAIHLLDIAEPAPIAEFIRCSVKAALALSNEIHFHMPVDNSHLRLKFNLPLLEISNLVKRRQLAYRLMVIERATGVQFKLPAHITASDVATIAMLHKAIISQSPFIWPLATYNLQLPASDKNICNIPASEPVDFKLPNFVTARMLFNKRIDIGPEIITVKEAITQNFEQIKHEMLANDQHIVKFTVLSLTGQAECYYPEMPGLPDNSWDQGIQQLINLEEALLDRLTDRYNALAVSTLAGLTEEEQMRVVSDSIFSE